MVSSGWTGGPGLTTFYFAAASLGAEGQPEAVEAAARVQAWGNLVDAVVTPTVTMNVQSAVDQLDPVTGNLVGGFTVPALAGISGSGGANSAPQGITTLGQFITGVVINGRRVRGRVFNPPPGTTQFQGNGNLAASAITDNNLALARLGVTVLTPLTHVVWHRPVGGSGGAQVAVSGYSTWGKGAVIRSRRD
jgi:hypothetical protein